MKSGNPGKQAVLAVTRVCRRIWSLVKEVPGYLIFEPFAAKNIR